MHPAALQVGYSCKVNNEITVKDIFLDNHNWDRFKDLYKDKIRDVEIAEVEKMLSCRESSRGFFEYYCANCDEFYTVYFGCNSRICTKCGKNYTDIWAKSLSKKMFRVPHRHLVLSIPDKLWGIVKENRYLLKVLMDSAIKAINSVFTYRQHREILAGAIVVLHPYGRDLGFRPHIHLLVTEGGFDKNRTFVNQIFISAEAMRKTWQYQVLTNFKKALPKTKENALLIDRLFKEYSNGFYVYLPKESRINSITAVSKYVGRYVRHPAIANYRICEYDGKKVTFWYDDNQDVRHYKTMDVDDFIMAIIQHIPDKQFKMIRYYGAYNRKWKKRYAHYLLESITQIKLCNFGEKRIPKCPKCGLPGVFIRYSREPPPEKTEKIYLEAK
jgi:hypothetical protein